MPRNVEEAVVEVATLELLPEQPEEVLPLLLHPHLPPQPQPEEAESHVNHELLKLLGSKCNLRSRREKEWAWPRLSHQTT